MKRFAMLVVLLLLAISLAACGSKQAAGPSGDGSLEHREEERQEIDWKEEVLTGDQYTYRVSKKGKYAMLVKYIASDPDPVVPEKIDGRTVVELGERTFSILR